MPACTCATFVILCEAVLSYDRLVVESTSILEQRGSLASSFAQAIQAIQSQPGSWSHQGSAIP
ncbi:hypothetical protein J3E69DRAFT_339731 [Trichoderma sp. SZMC 28015]